MLTPQVFSRCASAHNYLGYGRGVPYTIELLKRNAAKPGAQIASQPIMREIFITVH